MNAQRSLQRSPSRILSPVEIAGIVHRQKGVFLAVFVLAVLGMIACGLWTPMYQSEVKILVLRQRADTVITPAAAGSVQMSNNEVSEEDLNSEVELLNSNDLLRKVAESTDLASTTVSRVFAPGSPDTRLAKAVYKLGKDLKIEPIRKSDVISVQYKSRDPQSAYRVLSVLTNAYLEKHLELHRPSGEYPFFEKLAAQYEEGLKRAQTRLLDFNRENGIVAPQTERDMVLQRSFEFDADANQAKQAAAADERRAQTLQGLLNQTPTRVASTESSSQNEELLSGMQSTLLNLQLKHIEQLTKFSPNYALVRETEAQIGAAEKSIDSAKQTPVMNETTARNPSYDWLQQEIAKSTSDLDATKAREKAASSIAAKYRLAAEHIGQQVQTEQDLVRDARLQEDNYLLYVRKREEARMNDALDRLGIVNIAIAEQPSVPRLPVRSPVRSLLLMLLVGFTLSAPIAFAADHFDPSIRTPDEVIAYLGTPVLAALEAPGKASPEHLNGNQSGT
jgi:uncharacterized protein involved in exopolysaccharide biosynthesis